MGCIGKISKTSPQKPPKTKIQNKTKKPMCKYMGCIGKSFN